MRYNIFFKNEIDLSILPIEGDVLQFTDTLISDKVVTKQDVLVSNFLQIVSLELSNKEVIELRRNKNIIVEVPKRTELLSLANINGEMWTYPNEWADVVGGIDTYYNNPDANPSTHNYFDPTDAVTGEIVPTQVSKYRIDSLWDRNFKGTAIKVAILDTGCAIGQHPDVPISGGINVSDAALSYIDTVGHGTSMASIVTSRKNGNGIVGIAPLSQIYSVKVFGLSGNNPIYGISDALLAGLEWCFYNDINVINISLAWGAYSEAMQVAITKLVKKGVLISCAAGNGFWNDPKTSIVYPAGYRGVFSVGGKRGGHVFEFTENIVFTSVLPAETGKTLDYLLEAHIIGATIDGSYAKVSEGSSQSSATNTGILAILRQRFPNHSEKQIRKFLNRFLTTGSHGYKYFENFDFIKGKT